jgi:ATP-dependent Clp protease, protease subunit
MLLFLLYSYIVSGSIIHLNNDNLVNIRGEINNYVANNFIRDIYMMSNKTHDINVYINSPGGSVMAGNKMITMINSLREQDYNINCITDFSASMAFIIMQSCTKRYGLPNVIMMQHQMSLGIKGEINRIDSYLNFLHDVKNELNMMQSKRIGMDYNSFNEQIKDEWWIYGNKNKQFNILDDIVFITCDGVFNNYTHEGTFYDTMYNGCPLFI